MYVGLRVLCAVVRSVCVVLRVSVCLFVRLCILLSLGVTVYSALVRRCMLLCSTCV